jgi:hypothetical protein
LFRVCLGLLHLHERAILQAKSAAEVYQLLQKDLCHEPEVISKVMAVSPFHFLSPLRFRFTHSLALPTSPLRSHLFFLRLHLIRCGLEGFR